GALAGGGLGDRPGVLQQPQERPFQDRQQGRGAVADRGDRPDTFLKRVPGLGHGQIHLRHQPAVGAGPFGVDDLPVVPPDDMPGDWGAGAPAGVHHAERRLPGGPDDGGPVRAGYSESRAYGGGGGGLGVVGAQVAGAPAGGLGQQAGGGFAHLGPQG